MFYASVDRRYRSKEFFKLREELSREALTELVAVFRGLSGASELTPKVRDSRPDLLRCHLITALHSCKCPRERALEIGQTLSREHEELIEMLDDVRDLEALKNCLYLVISNNAHKRNMPFDTIGKKSLAPFVKSLDAICSLERAIILSPLVGISPEMLVFGALQRVNSRIELLTPKPKKRPAKK